MHFKKTHLFAFLAATVCTASVNAQVAFQSNITIDGQATAADRTHGIAINSAPGIDTQSNNDFGGTSNPNRLRASDNNESVTLMIDGTYDFGNKFGIFIDSDANAATGVSGAFPTGSFGETNAVASSFNAGMADGGWDTAIFINRDGGGNNSFVTVITYDAAGALAGENFIGSGTAAGGNLTSTVRGNEATITYANNNTGGADNGLEIAIPRAWLLDSGYAGEQFRVAVIGGNGGFDFLSGNVIPEVAAQIGNAAGAGSAAMASLESPVFYYRSLELVKSLDVTSNFTSIANGVHAAFVAVDDSVTTSPLIYVSSLNNSGANRASIPTLKIDDVFTTEVVSILDNNTGAALTPGVAVSRGSGGLAVDNSGNVFTAWTGNGGAGFEDSIRIRRYDRSGVLVDDITPLSNPAVISVNERMGGFTVDGSGSNIALTRFFNSTINNFAVSARTGVNTYSARTTPVHGDVATAIAALTPAGIAQRPRDLVYDDVSKRIFVNANGLLYGFAPSSGDLSTPANYAGSAPQFLDLSDGGNTPGASFAGFGVGVKADGSRIGYAPSQDPADGRQRTARIIDGDGNIRYIVGRANVPGNGTGADLTRPTDLDFFTYNGEEYVAVTDTNTSSVGTQLSRVALFKLPAAPANAAPTAVNLTVLTVAENTTGALGTLTTDDPDSGDSHTYQLVSGAGSADNGLFTIVGDELQITGAIDFETNPTLEIRVRTTDDAFEFESFEQELVITVTDVNEPATAIALTPSAIDENVPTPTTVGTLTSTGDPDSTNFTYTLVAGAGDTNNNLFAIVGDQLRTDAALDFEVLGGSLTIRVQTTDDGTPAASFEQPITITLNDLPDTNVNDWMTLND